MEGIPSPESFSQNLADWQRVGTTELSLRVACLQLRGLGLLALFGVLLGSGPLAIPASLGQWAAPTKVYLHLVQSVSGIPRGSVLSRGWAWETGHGDLGAPKQWEQWGPILTSWQSEEAKEKVCVCGGSSAGPPAVECQWADSWPESGKEQLGSWSAYGDAQTEPSGSYRPRGLDGLKPCCSEGCQRRVSGSERPFCGWVKGKREARGS